LRWFAVMEHLTDCRSFMDLREVFNSVDRVITKRANAVCVFDLGHGKSADRLIATIHFNTQTVFVLRLLTHAEYEVSQKRRTKPQLAGLELLKAVTESSGMTQAELAKLLDIEQGTVSKIMSGARSITLDYAKRLARRFNAAGGVLGSRLINKLFFGRLFRRPAACCESSAGHP
jgi:antitoxin component HigA of HigAB toxin-antitoxin module